MQSTVSFGATLLGWYDRNKRDLPWRETRDPYKIWLSEIILQQTRVAQGIPYYTKFINKFPTVHELAEADEQEILHTWQGLGYYTRARNMHACARQVVSQYGAQFPSSKNDLLSLLGIGDYTASAIASIAFDKPHAVVDGNVYRVLARLYGIFENILSGKSRKKFVDLADHLIARERPGDFNQAIMEFGATHCKPVNPLCESCPFTSECFAFKNNRVSELPVREKRNDSKRKRFFHYFILKDNGRIYLQKRTDRDIWKGLFEFFLIETGSPHIRDITNSIYEEIYKRTSGEPEMVVKHHLSHQEIHARFYSLNRKIDASAFSKIKKKKEGDYYLPGEIRKLPKPVLIQNYLKDKFF